MSKPMLKVTADFTKDLQAMLKQFKTSSVLVGIPETSKSRDDDSGMTNAQLLAINNYGSPANNIPARPVLQVGLRNAQDKITDQFKLAAQTVLSRGQSALDTYYQRAGIIAADSVKKAINDQDFDGARGPAESTLAARMSKGFLGIKSLIVTGQLRNSITWVIKGGRS